MRGKKQGLVTGLAFFYKKLNIKEVNNEQKEHHSS